MHFIIFLIPWVASYLTKDPIISYSISWVGSVLLIPYSIYIYQRVDGKLKFFKPIILAQVLFWSYTAISSIFYFFDTLGFVFLEMVNYPDMYEIAAIAKAQNHIILGHGIFLCGFFIYTKKITKAEYTVNIANYGYLKLSIITTIISTAVHIGPFAQLSPYLTTFSTICAVKFFGDSLKNGKYIFQSLAYFVIIMVYGFISGMKEGTLFPLIILGVTLYDHFGWAKTSVFVIPIFVAYFYYIPTVNVQVRNLNWGHDRGIAETFRNLNQNNILNEENISNNNWSFLTQRLSEMSMLTRYMESVPTRRPYYNSEIILSGLSTLVPRFLYPNKPIADINAQKRALENGALVLTTGDTSTSAKPQTIADAYLTHGYIGVVLTFFIMGFLMSYLSVLLESKFGYNFGITILFYTLFLVFTRGGCFENLIGTIFYGYVLFHVTVFLFEKFSLTTKVIDHSVYD